MRYGGIGEKLTKDVKESGYECNLVRLEVGALNVEKWNRTFSFYSGGIPSKHRKYCVID